MAKGNKKDRKQETKNEPKEYHDLTKNLFKIAPINEPESYQFKELFELNKVYTARLEQFQMHEYALARKQDEIKNYTSGAWPPKLLFSLNKQMSREISDVKEIIGILEREKVIISQALDNLRCQLEQQRDEFVECAVRCSSILVNKVGNREIKELTAARSTGLVYSAKEKEVIAKDIEAVSEEDLEKAVAAKREGKK